MRLNKDPRKQVKIYLFSYSFNNSKWSVEIPAANENEALQRLKKLKEAQFEGELQREIFVPSNN